MNTAMLTPQSNLNAAIVSVSKELSGAIWSTRFPGSIDTNDLTPDFKLKVDAFMAALKAAGASMNITSTYRPRQRSYLMHWAYRIYREDFDPSEVPPMPGVNIEWVHASITNSIAAAKKMVDAYGIQSLGVAPSLTSLHTVRQAIDVKIRWEGNLQITDGTGNVVTIDTLPRTGMNAQLKTVGRSFGVIKFVGGASDKPHWSTTGN